MAGMKLEVLTAKKPRNLNTAAPGKTRSAQAGCEIQERPVPESKGLAMVGLNVLRTSWDKTERPQKSTWKERLHGQPRLPQSCPIEPSMFGWVFLHIQPFFFPRAQDQVLGMDEFCYLTGHWFVPRHEENELQLKPICRAVIKENSLASHIDIKKWGFWFPGFTVP